MSQDGWAAKFWSNVAGGVDSGHELSVPSRYQASPFPGLTDGDLTMQGQPSETVLQDWRAGVGFLNMAKSCRVLGSATSSRSHMVTSNQGQTDHLEARG